MGGSLSSFSGSVSGSGSGDANFSGFFESSGSFGFSGSGSPSGSGFYLYNDSIAGNTFPENNNSYGTGYGSLTGSGSDSFAPGSYATNMSTSSSGSGSAYGSGSSLTSGSSRGKRRLLQEMPPTPTLAAYPGMASFEGETPSPSPAFTAYSESGGVGGFGSGRPTRKSAQYPEMPCYTFNEDVGVFVFWGRNSDLRLLSDAQMFPGP